MMGRKEQETNDDLVNVAHIGERGEIQTTARVLLLYSK